ncbi:MAG TPA: hypothetical protein DCZ95_16440 [Verrucomicrobia bacterium]|nr:hypothetical protein [Verrucomicrobiota bacterium]
MTGARVLMAAGLCSCMLPPCLSLDLPSRAANEQGGDLVIVKARIWAGDLENPWISATTERGGG